MTHRGVTHEFVVVSGHLPPGHPQSLVDWAAIGRLRGTVVVLMGVDTAPAIAAALVEHGRAPETPVAVVTTGRRRRNAPSGRRSPTFPGRWARRRSARRPSGWSATSWTCTAPPGTGDDEDELD